VSVINVYGKTSKSRELKGLCVCMSIGLTNLAEMCFLFFESGIEQLGSRV